MSREIYIREIIENSSKTIKIWHLTIFFFIMWFLISFVMNKSERDISLLLIPLIPFLICWLLCFIMEIALFRLLKGKYDSILGAERGNIDREKFDLLSNLKNIVLIAIIFNFLFPPIIPLSAIRYRWEIREFKKKERL